LLRLLTAAVGTTRKRLAARNNSANWGEADRSPEIQSAPHQRGPLAARGQQSERMRLIGILLTRATGTPFSTGAMPNDLWCADYKGEFRLVIEPGAIS
jgi:hypothetical protein